ncbi:MAG TPA: ATP-binding cassette domain-containing protein [Acidimicrobiales bacterium]|nr:ATP-binding cassette domain-containing protein [Acidimicrobiales bacterium]
MRSDQVGPLVQAEGLGRTFGAGPSAVVALHGATCQVFPGDQVALVGPSGSGKSTLLHLLAGLDRPTVGSLAWPGLGAPPAHLPAGTIGLVFQGPSLLLDLDVVENVALPLLLAGEAEADAMTGAAGMLRRLGLADLAGQLPEELSGGQAQRVAVARALAGHPRLLLADEPTGQLDRNAAAIVVDLLIHMAGRLGAGLVIATHDPTVAGRLPHRWTMLDGCPWVEERV